MPWTDFTRGQYGRRTLWFDGDPHPIDTVTLSWVGITWLSILTRLKHLKENTQRTRRCKLLIYRDEARDIKNVWC